MEEEEPRFGIGKRSWLLRGGVILLIVLIILAIVVPLTVFRTVGVGYGAVLVDPLGGTVSEPIVGPAWFFKAPWVSDIHIYYALDSVGMWTEGLVQGDYPAITPISKDGLRIEVDLLVRWSLDYTKLKELYQTFPNLDWKAQSVSSVVREITRDVVGQYTAIQIIENRSTITSDLSTEITASLYAEKSLVDSLKSVEVDLRDIAPPTDFLLAIESKLAAQQAKLQAEFERETILILANASATENIIKAEGEASSRLIIANGTAESIRIIGENTDMNATELTKLYLTLEALKEISSKTQNFVVILGQDDLTYLVPMGQETP
ncbi:MAG: prohibitin family protein [Candidatus Bathyarchaeota archaeon]|nr:MAG: prohibitin family protein [Candidatus Bathyarchaeota archaeon]